MSSGGQAATREKKKKLLAKKKRPQNEASSETKLSSLKLSDELKSLIDKKKENETTLASLERQIYALETSYLDDTHAHGNIVRGWSGFMSSSKSGGIARKRIKFSNSDRLFSLSSVTSEKALEGDPNTTSTNGSRAVKKQKTSQGSVTTSTDRKGPGRPRKSVPGV